MLSNVCSSNIRSSHSSKLLLYLLRILIEQTLCKQRKLTRSLNSKYYWTFLGFAPSALFYQVHAINYKVLCTFSNLEKFEQNYEKCWVEKGNKNSWLNFHVKICSEVECVCINCSPAGCTKKYSFFRKHQNWSKKTNLKSFLHWTTLI